MKRALGLVGVALLAVTAFGTRVHAGPIDRAKAAQAHDFILGLDYDEARRVLQDADADDPDVTRERGRLALYEGDCDSAVTLLSDPTSAASEEGSQLADIARGCARVTADTVIVEDKAANVWIRYQDEADRALTPLLVDTVVKARDALTRDLGVTWPKPTRIVVVRDLVALAAMTGLPYESASTTGTVAVAKWGRVTLLSPRASRHGYSWRDTVAHELTHLAVTRATVDRAPLWLQEGLAKREEVRWRDPGPFDDRPPPDSIVLWGIGKKLDLRLDQLGPSIAMLPSADAAMVAFAEVTSFVRYYAQTAGDEAVRKLLASLREGKKPDAAMLAASGLDLAAWDTRWRAELTSRPPAPTPAMLDLAEQPDARASREKVRLGELLFGRDHPAEALEEVAGLKGAFAEDPSVHYLQARALEKEGQAGDAWPLLADPKEVAAAYGPWWAIRGRLARGSHDNLADPSFEEAVAQDPLDAEAACQTLDASSRPPGPLGPLCDAARASGEPDLGKD